MAGDSYSSAGALLRSERTGTGRFCFVAFRTALKRHEKETMCTLGTPEMLPSASAGMVTAALHL